MQRKECTEQLRVRSVCDRSSRRRQIKRLRQKAFGMARPALRRGLARKQCGTDRAARRAQVVIEHEIQPGVRLGVGTLLRFAHTCQCGLCANARLFRLLSHLDEGSFNLSSDALSLGDLDPALDDTRGELCTHFDGIRFLARGRSPGSRKNGSFPHLAVKLIARDVRGGHRESGCGHGSSRRSSCSGRR